MEFDKIRKEVYSGTIDASKVKLSLSRRRFLRVFVALLVFVPPAYLAFYFEKIVVMWTAIGWGAFAFLWQLLYWSDVSVPKDKDEFEVANFYGKGTLIFLAVFWSVLIIGVSTALYLKALEI